MEFHRRWPADGSFRKNWILAPRITTQLARPHPNVPVSGSRRTKKSPYHQIRQEPYLKEFLGT